jgi:hypothetical protein
VDELQTHHIDHEPAVAAISLKWWWRREQACRWHRGDRGVSKLDSLSQRRFRNYSGDMKIDCRAVFASRTPTYAPQRVRLPHFSIFRDRIPVLSGLPLPFTMFGLFSCENPHVRLPKPPRKLLGHCPLGSCLPSSAFTPVSYLMILMPAPQCAWRGSECR